MNNMPGKRKCSNCRRPGHDIRTCFKQSFGKTYKLLQEYTQHVRFGVLPLIKKKSSINSNTAKGGYKEEQLVCDDLNTNTSLRNTFSQILGDEYNTCSKIPGKTKIDIQSKDKKLSAQVKKYKKNQIQQLDRHWCKYWLDKIPELSDIYSLLKTLCEIPLKPNGTHVKDNFPIAADRREYLARTLGERLHVFTTAELQIRDRTTVHTGGGQTSDVEARAAAKCMRLEQALASVMERAANLERALASTQYSLQTTMQERVQVAVLCSDWEVASREALGGNRPPQMWRQHPSRPSLH